MFDKREVDVERGVILQEIGQTLDTPDDIVFDWLQETAYPEQALGDLFLGLVRIFQGSLEKIYLLLYTSIIVLIE